MNIKGKVVTLRALEMEDLPLLTKWSNAPEIWYNLGGWHFPYSSLSTEEYIKNINNNNMINIMSLLYQFALYIKRENFTLSFRGVT